MSRCLHQRTSILFLALITFLISPVAQHRAQGEDQPTAVTTNDILAEVGARIPEFGGMFVDEENDTLYVYAVGGGQELAASFDAAITAVLGRDRPPQTRLKVLQGRYSFVQLKEWHDRMSMRVLSIPGTVLTEIDQTTNRLKVGVEKLALEPDVLAEVAELGVPREAVIIEEMPRLEFETLTQPASPLVEDTPAGDTCTPVAGQPAGCCTLATTLTTPSPAQQNNNITVQATRVEGSSRPEVVMKTKVDTACKDNNGAVAGIAATFDTGSDTSILTSTHSTDLDVPTGTTIKPIVGGILSYNGNPVKEDMLLKCGNLNSSPDGTTIVPYGFVGPSTRVDVQAGFDVDVLGTDFLLGSVVSVYDPNNSPKTIDLSFSGEKEANFPSGGQIVLSSPAAATFNPKLKLTANLTKFGGFGFRPTLQATFTNGDKSKRMLNAVWDTGAPNSIINDDLISCPRPDGTCPNNTLICAKMCKTDKPGTDKEVKRATIDQFTFGPNGNVLTIQNWQAVRMPVNKPLPADVPVLIGMNVLDQFKMLIDLHQRNPIPANPTGIWGLQRTPVFRGKITVGGRLIETARAGSTVTVQWTDGNGQALFDRSGNPVPVEVKIVPASGRLEFTAPANTQDFIQSVLVPVGRGLGTGVPHPEVACNSQFYDCNGLMVEALVPRAAGPAGLRERGLPDNLIPAGFDIGNIWDALVTQIKVSNEPPDIVATIPDLFLDDHTPLYEGVELSTYLAGLASREIPYDQNWIDQPFYLYKGQVMFGGEALAGVYVGTTPLELNYLAGPNDALFLNAQASGGARALSQHSVVMPGPAPGSGEN